MRPVQEKEARARYEKARAKVSHTDRRRSTRNKRKRAEQRNRAR